MERNISYVKRSEVLRDGARALAERAVEHARLLIGSCVPHERTERAGRKASGLVEAMAEE